MATREKFDHTNGSESFHASVVSSDYRPDIQELQMVSLQGLFYLCECCFKFWHNFEDRIREAFRDGRTKGQKGKFVLSVSLK